MDNIQLYSDANATYTTRVHVSINTKANNNNNLVCEGLILATTHRATLNLIVPVGTEYTLSTRQCPFMDADILWTNSVSLAFCCLLNKKQEVQPLHLQGSLHHESWRSVISDEDPAALDLNNLNCHWFFRRTQKISNTSLFSSFLTFFSSVVRESGLSCQQTQFSSVSLYKTYQTWWIKIHNTILLSECMVSFLCTIWL